VNSYTSKWRKKNNEYYKQYRKEHYKKNSDKIHLYDKKRNPLRHLKLKTEIMEAYGGPACMWCGDEDIISLTIDHINNDGARHRREIKSKTIYKWLKKNNFPAGFQVLCCNCNHCKQYNHGILPPWRKDINRKPKILMFSLSEYARK
jgi:hypothetical protein